LLLRLPLVCKRFDVRLVIKPGAGLIHPLWEVGICIVPFQAVHISQFAPKTRNQLPKNVKVVFTEILVRDPGLLQEIMLE
jgi:hypothetical protein